MRRGPTAAGVKAGHDGVPLEEQVEEAVPAAGAGFGSTVEVEDAEDGSRSAYTLMPGPVIDIDAGQVSVASPIGHALLGALPGDVVTVEAPLRRRSLRVLAVRTPPDGAGEEPWPEPAA